MNKAKINGFKLSKSRWEGDIKDTNLFYFCKHLNDENFIQDESLPALPTTTVIVNQEHPANINYEDTNEISVNHESQGVLFDQTAVAATNNFMHPDITSNNQETIKETSNQSTSVSPLVLSINPNVIVAEPTDDVILVKDNFFECFDFDNLSETDLNVSVNDVNLGLLLNENFENNLNNSDLEQQNKGEIEKKKI